MHTQHLLVCVGQAASLPPCRWTHRTELPGGTVIAVVMPGAEVQDPTPAVPAEATIQRTAGNALLWVTDNRQSGAPGIELGIEHSRVHIRSDRFGQIPVYYCHHSNYWCFSTRLQWLTALSESAPGIDHKALYQYLYFHCIPAPATIYEDIHRIDAAHSLTLDTLTDRCSSQSNWKPDFIAANSSTSELQSQLFSQLQQAVTERYEAGTGTFLSGGLDSSSITGMMCRYTEGRDAYSIGFPIERYDESRYAQCAASHFGAQLKSHSIQSHELVEQLPFIIKGLEQPFGNSSIVPTYFCAAMAKRDGKRVLLAGDGGDELFGGNERYRKQLLFEHFSRLPRPLQAGIRALLSITPQRPALVAKASSYIAQASSALPERLQSYNLLKRIDLTQLLAPDYLNECSNNECDKLMQGRYSEVKGDCLDRMLYLDWKFTLSDNDLVKVNSMCSLAGIEVRYPMLDHKLVDLSTSIPSGLKVHRSELRYLFKRSMHSFLPDEIINKPKHGFGLPYGYWLQDDKKLKSLTFEAINSLSSLDLFQPQLADRVLALNQGEHAHYFGELAWVLMALGMWLDSVHRYSDATEQPPMRVPDVPCSATSAGSGS